MSRNLLPARGASRRVLALSVVAAGLLTTGALPGGAVAGSLVVQGDRALSSWKHRQDPTLGAATRALGQPSTIRRRRAVECVVRWRSLGVKAWFLNRAGENPCGPASGSVDRIEVDRAKWRTARGLRVGNRVKRLRKLHPAARRELLPDPVRGARRTGNWWLVRRPYLGDASNGLLAVVKRGRVTRFVIYLRTGSL